MGGPECSGTGAVASRSVQPPSRVLGRLARDMHALSVFARHHLFGQAASPQGAGIDVEVVERQSRIFVDRLLLRLKDVMVLIVDALAVVDVRPLNVPSELLVTFPKGSDEIPEIVTALLGIRRDRRQKRAVDALRAITLWRARPGERNSDVADYGGRRLEIYDLPTIHMARLAQLLRPERRRVDIDHPAGDRRGAIRMSDLEGRTGDRFVANAARMDVGFMRQVHEVVDYEAVVAAQAVERDPLSHPLRSFLPMEIGQLGGIGKRRIARPQPNQTMPLDGGVGADTSRGIDGLLGRHVGAPSRRVEHQPMIATHDLIVLETAH